jgi:hypothetical protein
MVGKARVALLVTLLTLAATLVAIPGASADESAQQVCAMFPHAQTYRDGTGFYQAPAWRYGRSVTIRYTASSCDVTSEGRTTTIAVGGTAFIFEGSGYGSASVAKGFSFTMTSRTPEGQDAWPVAWWDCTNTYVDYRWTISGVYDFILTARRGVWTATQRALGRHPAAATVTHSGCR